MIAAFQAILGVWKARPVYELFRAKPAHASVIHHKDKNQEKQHIIAADSTKPTALHQQKQQQQDTYVSPKTHNNPSRQKC